MPHVMGGYRFQVVCLSTCLYKICAPYFQNSSMDGFQFLQADQTRIEHVQRRRFEWKNWKVSKLSNFENLLKISEDFVIILLHVQFFQAVSQNSFIRSFSKVALWFYGYWGCATSLFWGKSIEMSKLWNFENLWRLSTHINELVILSLQYKLSIWYTGDHSSLMALGFLVYIVMPFPVI